MKGGEGRAEDGLLHGDYNVNTLFCDRDYI